MSLRLAIGCCAALFAASPAAASTTIGSTLRARADLFTRCETAGCTELQTGLRAQRLTAPAGEGVITRWRVRAATLGGARLRVFRPAGTGGALTAVGTTDWVPLDRRHPPGADVLYEFPARIRVAEGDVVALDRDRRSGGVFHAWQGNAAYRAAQFAPIAPLDAVELLPSSNEIGAELLLNADIEADKDGDGYGDETQDNCPSIANDQTSNPCPRAQQTGDGTGTGTGTGTDGEGTSTIVEPPRRFRRHRARPAPRPLPSRAPKRDTFTRSR